MIYPNSVSVLNFEGKTPEIHSSVFLADGCRVVGDVKIAEDSSLWFNAVCRADVGSIIIGKGSNIQDNSVVHLNHSGPQVVIGDYVTVGHSVTLHGCSLEDGCLIGMGSTLLDGVQVGRSSFVAAGSLLTPGKVFPPYVLIQGRPGRVVRELTKDEIENHVYQSPRHYIKLKNTYLKTSR